MKLTNSLGEEMNSDNIVTENLAELPAEDWCYMDCLIYRLSCHSENVAKITDNKMNVANVENNNMLLTLLFRYHKQEKIFCENQRTLR